MYNVHDIHLSLTKAFAWSTGIQSVSDHQFRIQFPSSGKQRDPCFPGARMHASIWLCFFLTVDTTIPRRGTQAYWDHVATNPPLPKYWKHLKKNSTLLQITKRIRDPTIFRYDVDADEFDAISNLVQVTRDIVGQGRDARNLSHDDLFITRIERIENLELLAKYAQKRQQFLKRKASPNYHFVPLEKTYNCRAPIMTAKRISPLMTSDIFSEINECYLFHGTKNEYLENIIRKGLNPRFGSDRAMFGPGIYAAENSTKADQYAGKSQIRLFHGYLLLRVNSSHWRGFGSTSEGLLVVWYEL